VTGTSFNVRTDATASLDVTVLEGSVAVRPGTQATRALHAGDHLSLAGDQVRVTPLSAGQLEDTLAWRQGLIVFDGTPLREALDRFARYHGRSLTAADGAAARLVGGRYSLDDLDGFLSFVEQDLKLRVSRAADGTILVAPPAGT